jgi:hypothetical protein
VTVYTGGKHTFASQYVGANTKAGTVVIASDNVYTYENLEKHVPIAVTLDAKSNLAAHGPVATYGILSSWECAKTSRRGQFAARMLA